MPDFNTFYEDELTSEVAAIEAQRKKYGEKRKRLVRILMIVVGLISVVAGIVLNKLSDSFGIALVTIFSTVISGYLLVDHLVKLRLKKIGLGELQNRFKNEVVKKVLLFIDPSLNYDPDGNLSKEELLRSQLLNIKRNTTVKVDDVVSGLWKGNQLMIINLIMRSRVRKDQGFTKDDSTQGFNGLLVEVKKEFQGSAFVIPKSKMNKSISSVAGMKFKRDPGMSLTEQKAFNMQVMSQGMNMDFSWSPSMSALAAGMDEHDLNADSQKPYKAYCDTDNTFQQITKNEKLQRLLSDGFVDHAAIQELAEVKSFQLLDHRLLDSTVRTTLTYAIHSGSIWVLIPGWQDKFELTLDQEVTKKVVESAYDDFRLALASVEPFL
ncbi:hypothetical protein FNH22_14975 [Fulvivirga sp. M361]|uniref:hypothetical protein n=1 Tax=Fulvivirga sp. M361 TaxID=2594266 RepID=UPI00117AC862|nr:hypothetical protein [Fulvivirga sp. M361]TRX57712.1 hypothetical protein FNH22_14975 [Fulvivirga sp. M361]